MLGVGTRKLLFWITLVTVLGAAGLLVRRPVCADVDPSAYMTLFALGPLVLVVDAVVSILRQKAKDFTHVLSTSRGLSQISIYKPFLLSGKHAVSLGRSRLVFPAIALILVAVMWFVYGQISLPKC